MSPKMTDEGWEDYYRARQGREPRPLFLEILQRLESKADWQPEQRFAIDLGCGDGTETALLLAHGWQVLAIDAEPAALRYVQAKAPAEAQGRLETVRMTFEDLVLPAADLVYAGFSLPFCTPARFNRTWAVILNAVRPGGFFGGNLFGDHDTWAGEPTMTVLSRAQAEQLFPASFQVEIFREIEADGPSYGGPKHWHQFELLAQRIGMD